MNYVVDDIGKVITQMAKVPIVGTNPVEYYTVSYLFGHEQEITNRLLRQQQNPAVRAQRYPLIALFLDIEEPIINGVINYKLNLVIVAKTDPNDDASERYEDTKPFKAVLYPLYESFFKSLSDSGLFMWPAITDKPKHSKYDRPFWGTPKNNERGTQATTANIFNDYLDAIQIKNLEVNQKLKNC